MEFLKQDLDQYERWRGRWEQRPRHRIIESKVVKNEDGSESMYAFASAPGFRPEKVIVTLPSEEPVVVPTEVEGRRIA